MHVYVYKYKYIPIYILLPVPLTFFSAVHADWRVWDQGGWQIKKKKQYLSKAVIQAWLPHIPQGDSTPAVTPPISAFQHRRHLEGEGRTPKAKHSQLVLWDKLSKLWQRLAAFIFAIKHRWHPHCKGWVFGQEWAEEWLRLGKVLWQSVHHTEAVKQDIQQTFSWHVPEGREQCQWQDSTDKSLLHGVV